MSRPWILLLLSLTAPASTTAVAQAKSPQILSVQLGGSGCKGAESKPSIDGYNVTIPEAQLEVAGKSAAHTASSSTRLRTRQFCQLTLSLAHSPKSRLVLKKIVSDINLHLEAKSEVLVIANSYHSSMSQDFQSKLGFQGPKNAKAPILIEAPSGQTSQMVPCLQTSGKNPASDLLNIKLDLRLKGGAKSRSTAKIQTPIVIELESKPCQ